MSLLQPRAFVFKCNFRKLMRHSSQLSDFIVGDDVKSALEGKKPIVALESTIITHGMPFPQNLKCALEVEEIVRSKGVIPATIAVIDGLVKVGLTETDIRQLADVEQSRPIKTSRRDLAYVVSSGRNGGTTVSGTLVVAGKMGIPIFATGGIGGVHRGGETTFDISADLTELGRSGVAVVSSGIKSILDIARTLEYLETRGVLVATFGRDRHFPAFYSRKSGCYAPYHVQTAEEAAKIIYTNRGFDLRSGMLFAVPVPEEFAMEDVINDAIDEALCEAEAEGVKGKEITPFLLQRIGVITGGRSLEANVALIKNNARVAACIAVELAKMRPKEKASSKNFKDTPSPVVIGGSNLDCSIKVETGEIRLDGRIHFGKSTMSGGGVARNICEALTKLDCRPFFISVVGNDPQGRILRNFIPQEADEKVKVLKGHTTAQATVVLDRKGECRFLAGDMEIHKEITTEMILKHESTIKGAPLIVFDANLSISSIETILELAGKYNIPAFYEPTDLAVCAKAFKTKNWKAIKYISPNFHELKEIAAHFKISKQCRSKLEEIAYLASELNKHIENIIVTLGADGAIVARRGKASQPFLKSENGKLEIRHYPARPLAEVDSVSGAGDSLTSGVISAMLYDLSEEICMSVGLSAAECSLRARGPVPERFFKKGDASWSTKAAYKTLV